MNIRKIILNDNLVRSRVFDTRKPSKSKTDGEIQTPPFLLTPYPFPPPFFFMLWMSAR